MFFYIVLYSQRVTKICRLSWLTNRALVYMNPNAEGGGGGCGASANECSCTHGAQINFGDLTPYLNMCMYRTSAEKVVCNEKQGGRKDGKRCVLF